MKLQYFSEEDLEDLDAKFDALAEFLGVEFVFERVSDGSDVADASRCYARYKDKGETRPLTQAESSVPSFSEKLPPEVEMPEEVQAVEPPPIYEKKKKKGYYD